MRGWARIVFAKRSGTVRAPPAQRVASVVMGPAGHLACGNTPQIATAQPDPLARPDGYPGACPAFRLHHRTAPAAGYESNPALKRVLTIAAATHKTPYTGENDSRRRHELTGQMPGY